MRCNRCNGKITFDGETYQCLRCGKEIFVPRNRTGAKSVPFKGNVQLIRHPVKDPLIVLAEVANSGSVIELKPQCPYCKKYMNKHSYGYLKDRHRTTTFKCTEQHEVILKHGENKKIVGWW